MQAIRTRYIGATNGKPARMTAACEALTITVRYDHALAQHANHATACRALMERMQWHGSMFGGEFKQDYYWTFTDRNNQDFTSYRAE